MSPLRLDLYSYHHIIHLEPANRWHGDVFDVMCDVIFDVICDVIFDVVCGIIFDVIRDVVFHVIFDVVFDVIYVIHDVTCDVLCCRL